MNNYENLDGFKQALENNLTAAICSLKKSLMLRRMREDHLAKELYLKAMASLSASMQELKNAYDYLPPDYLEELNKRFFRWRW